jgi:hypothetical protein
MPSSDTAQISTIVDLVQIIDPKSILDIGCGFGKYGYLFREYLMGDLWDKNKILLNAVEGYEKYITEVQRAIYNEIFICNAMDFSSYLNQRYDLICIIDAFEHLSAADGKIFIENVSKNTKYLLISVPRFVGPQQGYTDDPNKFELHCSFWTRKMFKSISNCLIIPNSARKTIALYSNDGIFGSSIRKFSSKKLYLKLLPYILIDGINYMNWFTRKNNKEEFLQKSDLGK